MAVANPAVPVDRGFSAFDEIVTINVGEDGRATYVHRSVLSSSSDFSKAKLKPEWSWKEAVTIKLPDHAPSAFNLYVNWLYIHSIPLQAATQEDNELHTLERSNLAAAFVVGEALLDATFKDVVMDALRAKVRGAKGSTIWDSLPCMVQNIYDGTPIESPARKFVVDICHFGATRDKLHLLAATAPIEFYVDLLGVFTNIYNTESFAYFGGKKPPQCRYHSHGEEQACYLDS